MLVETKSYSETARRIFVTQPAVSQQIQKLQSELSCQLVQKINNQLVLTAKGRTLYESIKVPLESLQQATWNLVQNDLHTSYSIMGPYVYINSTLIPKLGSITPTLGKYNFQFGNSLQVGNALLSGEIDVGIVSTPLPERLIDSSCIFTEQMKLVMNKDYYGRYNWTSPLQVVDMDENYRLLTPWLEHNTSIFKQHKHLQKSLVAQIKSIEGIINFVKNNPCAAVVPVHLISDSLQAGSLIDLFPTGTKYINKLYLCHLKNKRDHDSNKLFHTIVDLCHNP
ncbi:MAG: LysR family transcriptional regulator [Bacteriovoracaceae bacterium]|nr:LysR family transcriptional regulator [Bacteriovoracaceae bacterium]